MASKTRVDRFATVFSTFDPRRSLRARIAVVVAGLTLILSVILTVVVGQISGQQLERSIGQTLAQLSSNVIRQLDQTMFERWREIRITASQGTLFSAPDSVAAVRSLLNQLRATYREYSWLGWADASGTVIASTDGLLEGQSVADTPWFQHAQHSAAPYIGNLHEAVPNFNLWPDTENETRRFFDIAMPVRTSDGELLGVLGAYVDWRFMAEPSNAVERQFASQADLDGAAHSRIDVFILTPEGKVLIGPPTFSSPTLDKLPQLSLLSVKAARTGQTGYITENWPDSSDAFLTGYAKDMGYRGYPGMGWIVLIRERADYALASVSQLQVLLLAIGVVFACVFSVIGWLLAIQITHPLVQVAALAREIKTGDIHDTLPGTIDRGDEVSVLSHTIDRLLVALNARNHQLTELNSNLERTIKERIIELAASQRFNEKIVNMVPDLVYIFDLKQGHNVFVNQATDGLPGYGVEPLKTADSLDPAMIHPDDLKEYHANQERIRQAADGTLIEQVYRLKHHDGHWIWIHCRETVFARDPVGNVTQVLGVAQDISLRKQAEDELQEIAAAQERQRLARELHDSVSQTLFSASMVAEMLPLLWDKGETVVKKNLDELARLTRGALAEMRTLLNELRPTAIETADLRELLTHLLDAARGRSQAEWNLSFEGEGALPPDVQVAVYRVAQEALNNVIKHARARHVEVRLIHGPGLVEMQIKDDGRGFKEDQSASDHFGLGIMQERAQEVGADVTLHSQPGRGTEIVFTWRAPAVAQSSAREVTA